MLFTLTVHVGIDIQLSDMNRWSWLNPDTLPDSAARCVENVRGVESLLSNRYYIIATVCWIVDEDEPIDCQ